MFKNLRSTCTLAAASAVPVVLASVPAFAVDANMDTLFAAVDITGMATRVTTLLAVAIVIPGLWFGYRQLKKVMNRAA